MGRSWIPVRRDWRLNERHYGDLTGRNKAETAAQYGADQVKVWRRSYDMPPPPIAADERVQPQRTTRATRSCPPDVLPAHRVPGRRRGADAPLLVRRRSCPTCTPGGPCSSAAHGNSLRALVKHLDGITDDDIAELNIPTGEPLVYELGDDLAPLEAKPVEERYLRSAEEIRAAAEAVARQAEGT